MMERNPKWLFANVDCVVYHPMVQCVPWYEDAVRIPSLLVVRMRKWLS